MTMHGRKKVSALTQQQLNVYHAIAARKPTSQIAEELGITRQRVFSIRTTLRKLGVLQRRLPGGATLTEAYVWEPVPGMGVAGKPALRVAYPVDSQEDPTVPPIRYARLGTLAVQGVRILNPDGSSGRHGHDRVPDLCAVVVFDLSTGERWVFLASPREDWSARDTARVLGASRATDELTMLIACAIGVEAVLDIEEIT